MIRLHSLERLGGLDDVYREVGLVDSDIVAVCTGIAAGNLHGVVVTETRTRRDWRRKR